MEHLLYLKMLSQAFDEIKAKWQKTIQRHFFTEFINSKGIN